MPDRSTLEEYPLSQDRFGLRFQSFVFVGYPYVVLDCAAIVCLTSEVTSECDRSCNSAKPTASSGSSGRKRRDVLEESNGETDKTVYRVFSQRIMVVVEPMTSSTGECLLPFCFSHLLTKWFQVSLLLPVGEEWGS